MKIRYIKIRADFRYTKKGRFFRTFLIREDIGLGELGEFIVYIFGGTMEHYFMYHTIDKSYIPSSWVEQWDALGGKRKHEPFIDHIVNDLPEKFIFIYDTGDGWDFDCKMYRNTITKSYKDDEYIPMGFVLDGKGMGIWEDNISTLYMHLDGEIDKDYSKEDKEKGIYKPWNFKIKKYSEFDGPINIDELNKRIVGFKPHNQDKY